MNTSSIVLSISLIVAGVIGIGLAIPMLLSKIPRNAFYGFRTKRTLDSDEIWYPANRFAAKGLLVWGMLNILIGIISLWFHPLSDGAQLLLIIPPLSVILPCLISYLWIKKKFPETEQGAAANP